MRIFESIDIGFISSRTKGYIFSGILLTLSVASLSTRGLELGIDFQGGMEFVVETTERLEATDVRESLTSALGTAPEVKLYGDRGLLIRTPRGDEEITDVQATIIRTVEALAPDLNPQLVKTDVVGPRFAEDLKRGALYSVLGSLLVIFVYILIRFEWRYSLGAVAALFHDVLITLGLFSLLPGVLPFSLQIDQTIIAAFLTIVGYSLNDTVVIFDRIREYTKRFRTESFDYVVNVSVNRTLSRTIVTSGTTLLVVLTLFIFGGEVLRGFAFALIVGILIGTYSSIFVAAPVVVELRTRASSRLAAPRTRPRSQAR